MSTFKFPGVVWSALFFALPLLAVWLEQFFAGAIWAAPVAALLLIIAKVIEHVRATQPPPAAAIPSPEAAFETFEGYPERAEYVPVIRRSLLWG